jgi:hypothetical protein
MNFSFALGSWKHFNKFPNSYQHLKEMFCAAYLGHGLCNLQYIPPHLMHRLSQLCGMLEILLALSAVFERLDMVITKKVVLLYIIYSVPQDYLPRQPEMVLSVVVPLHQKSVCGPRGHNAIQWQLYPAPMVILICNP